MGALVYGWALGNPFYFDDIYIIQNNVWLSQGPPANWFQMFYVESGYVFSAFRPLLMWGFEQNYHWLGGSPESFRLVNLLFHILNAVAVAWLAQFYFRNNTIALIAGLIFLLHPVQTLAINMVWKRSTIFSVFFILAGCVFHLRYQHKIKLGYLVIGHLLCMLLSVLHKELGVIYPAIIMSLQGNLIWKNLVERKHWILYTVLFILAGIFFWYRIHYFGAAESSFKRTISAGRGLARADYFVFSLDILSSYLKLFIIPKPQLIDDPTFQGFTPRILITVTALLGSLIALIKWRKHAWVIFVVSVFWIPFMPTSSIFRQHIPQDQIRMYLPLIAFAFLVARGLYQLNLILRPQLVKLISIFLMVTYASVSLMQNLQYRCEECIWGDVLEAYPQSEIALDHLGHLAMNYRDFELAHQYYARAAQLVPNVKNLQIKALHADILSQTEISASEKEQYLRHIERLDRGKDLTHLDEVALSTLEFNLGEFESARDRLLKLLSDVPQYAPPHCHLGRVFQSMADNQNARKAFLNCLRLDPHSTMAKAALNKLEG